MLYTTFSFFFLLHFSKWCTSPRQRVSHKYTRAIVVISNSMGKSPSPMAPSNCLHPIRLKPWTLEGRPHSHLTLLWWWWAIINNSHIFYFKRWAELIVEQIAYSIKFSLIFLAPIFHTCSDFHVSYFWPFSPYVSCPFNSNK